MKTYSYKGQVITASSKEEAIQKIIADAPSIKDELVKFRKTITKNYNVRIGEHDSLLVIECNNHKGALKLKELLDSWNYVKHLERSLNLTFQSTVENNSVCAEFIPNKPVFVYNNLKLSLSEFLYVTKDSRILDKFIARNNLKDVNSVLLGSNSCTAIGNLSYALRRYKDRLYVEMINPGV